LRFLAGPLSGKTRGSNRLLKEGARLVDCAEDIIEELAPQLSGGARTARPGTAEQARPERRIAVPPGREQQFQAVIQRLTPLERVHLDSIIESSGMNAQTVLGVLLELELSGAVTQHPGKLFSLAQI
jgi:DNA processing protein